MASSLLFLLLTLFHHPQVSTWEAAAAADAACLRDCGGVYIPYPFGTSPNCSLPGFLLSCNSSSHPPSLFISGTDLLVLNITNGQLRVDSTAYVAIDCISGRRTPASISLPPDGPFTISGASNRFTAIGCDTVAVVNAEGGSASQQPAFTSGCVSLCAAGGGVSLGCSGVGCCESEIPEGRRNLSLGAGNMFGYANVSTFGNCSYAFVAERGGFQFSEGDLRGFPPAKGRVAMKVDWAVIDGHGRRTDASGCGENAYCVPSVRGSGHLCYCSIGFSGNSYISGSDGCQDVDECQNPKSSPCVHGSHCHNRVPGFRCQCPFGSTGDGTKHGSGCRQIFQIIEAVLGTVMAISLMLLCGLYFYFALKQRVMVKLKEQYFRQNGGLLLKQQVSRGDGSTADRARIFSSDELKEATSNYADERILGTGGYGTVYKGILPDNTTVAIKKSKVMDQAQIDQFINEVLILSQINHRNVVKLLGCCLETEVPLLVYEFISNGTLYQHLHESHYSVHRIHWIDRLRIATETAEALSYLHSAASMPVFHRDVKSSNILLDEHYTAKVSDFGLSRLVPLDQTQVPTLVQGTLGYLDPEYFQSGQLTAKSDVYSFGVVLVELLTGKKPVSFERPREESNLAKYFLCSLKGREFVEFVDGDVMGEARVEQVKSVAELARRCLMLRGEKRPTMKEVAQELALVAGYGRHGGDEDEGESEMQLDQTVLEFEDSLPLGSSEEVELQTLVH